MNIIPLFCQIDDAFIASEQQRIPSQLPQIPDAPKKRGHPRRLHPSEVMTILVAFHQSQYPNVEALLPKARLSLLALGVPKTRQL